VDGALLLDADPAWAGAINTVLVKQGVRVSELCRACPREQNLVLLGLRTSGTTGGLTDSKSIEG
jgi:hypothetical protein